MVWEILVCMVWGLLVAESATMVTTLYLHRASTHKSVQFSKGAEFIFQFILWLTTGIRRNEWVAVHLCHHAHTDEVGDPHSPTLLGFWKVQLGNVLLYRRAARDQTVLQYGKNIQLSWMERHFFRFSTVGLGLGILIACFTLGWWRGLLTSFVHAIVYLQLNSLVNAYCHVWGYKNFSNAHAFNSRWVAWITGGEGYHNNHHHRPGSPKLSDKPREFDIGWGLIRILTWLRMARANR